MYFGLGSNQGDREAALRAALLRLHTPDFRIVRVSSVYETAAMYLENQPPFLNAVAEAETSLFPMQLLTRISRAEREMGRRRTVRNGPRVIDIDVLLFGNFVISAPRLTVPHPRLQERRFVLEPLAELAPGLRHPITRKTMQELLAGTLGQTVRRVDVVLAAPLDEEPA